MSPPHGSEFAEVKGRDAQQSVRCRSVMLTGLCEMFPLYAWNSIFKIKGPPARDKDWQSSGGLWSESAI